jgi:uncharacterized membrane protein YvbJ
MKLCPKCGHANAEPSRTDCEECGVVFEKFSLYCPRCRKISTADQIRQVGVCPHCRVTVAAYAKKSTDTTAYRLPLRPGQAALYTWIAIVVSALLTIGTFAGLKPLFALAGMPWWLPAIFAFPINTLMVRALLVVQQW